MHITKGQELNNRACLRGQDGLGLIEVIAALGISVVVLTSLVSLSLFTLRSSLRSKLQLEGTKIANRELELVRAYRDAITDWQKDEETDPDGFMDILVPDPPATPGCTALNVCHMDTSGSLSIEEGSNVTGSGPEAITRYFYAVDPDSPGSSPQLGDQEVRIVVVVEWDVGDDPKDTRLYTDLTNWEKK